MALLHCLFLSYLLTFGYFSDNLHLCFLQNEPIGDFDDLGADLCPMPDSNFPDFLESDKNNFMGNKKDDIAGSRYNVDTIALHFQHIVGYCFFFFFFPSFLIFMMITFGDHLHEHASVQRH